MATIVETLEPTLFVGTTALYSVDLEDEDGIAVAVASLNSLTLTYEEPTSATVINDRAIQDAWNTNDVLIETIPATESTPDRTRVTWTMQPEDTVLVEDWREVEYHRIVLRWTWDSGTHSGAHAALVGIQHLPE